ncbi:transmembrane emp24 domain-containing protein 7-like [Artemia franciscana]|uniref:GOLD domain-containing protein n=1 Tax=Artemia franciscana TaxID=6661 RepID=A0AA88I0T4_ARTSF|nr:hypothetical protein QYM36_006647 [Artemia franciscana]
MKLPLLILLGLFGIVLSVELTFEVQDKGSECFYQDLTKGESSTIEFQVVTGGHYDIDMTLKSPKDEVLFQAVQKQYDSHTFNAGMEGTYSACFSNEFSTFSHKLVYVDWQVNNEEPLPGMEANPTAMTQMETSAQSVHENLNTIIDYQTHHRLRESQGRKRAEIINDRVMVWSIGETVAILVVSVGQVWIVKSFFDERRPI